MTQPEQTLAQRKVGPKEIKRKGENHNNYKCDYKITVNDIIVKNDLFNNIRFNGLHNRKL